jgi:hypothetical protein
VTIQLHSPSTSRLFCSASAYRTENRPLYSRYHGMIFWVFFEQATNGSWRINLHFRKHDSACTRASSSDRETTHTRSLLNRVHTVNLLGRLHEKSLPVVKTTSHIRVNTRVGLSALFPRLDAPTRPYHQAKEICCLITPHLAGRIRDAMSQVQGQLCCMSQSSSTGLGYPLT